MFPFKFLSFFFGFRVFVAVWCQQCSGAVATLLLLLVVLLLLHRLHNWCSQFIQFSISYYMPSLIINFLYVERNSHIFPTLCDPSKRSHMMFTPQEDQRNA